MPGKGTADSIKRSQALQAVATILTHAVLMYVSDTSLNSERGLLLMAPNSFMMHIDCPGIRIASRADLISGVGVSRSTGAQPVASLLFDGWEYDEEELFNIRRIVDMATPPTLPRAIDDILRCANQS